MDDDLVLSEMYKNIFKEKGYETYVAFDGYDGLIKANSILPDIILMDMMMPKLNGLDVLDKLKKNPLTSAIPVVILTNIEKVAEEKVIAKGAAKYITKSEYNPPQLVALVETILDGKIDKE
ncbi:response regulator [Candidatus Roizmanbacteria bacterium]|nr:response regulator [Candidatus Roizmanbacteria bacterium]